MYLSVAQVCLINVFLLLLVDCAKAEPILHITSGWGLEVVRYGVGVEGI